MNKSAFLKVRVDADELRDLKREASVLGVSLSQYVRLLLSRTVTKNASQGADVESLKSALDEIRAEMREAAKAHVALAERIAELTRVPTFREYRSRALAEGIEQRPGESETSYLTRLAVRYFAMYGKWPDPREKPKFGGVGAGFDLQKWPTEPPK